jgi:hypothetical protein
MQLLFLYAHIFVLSSIIYLTIVYQVVSDSPYVSFAEQYKKLHSVVDAPQ